MGLSASQARLIQLEARMVDVEYEAQQINQQRLTLSNKMNEVYEMTCNMDVPTPPSKIDFAYNQYTGRQGGTNISVRPGADGTGALKAYQTVQGPIVSKTVGSVGGTQKINLQDVTSSLVATEGTAAKDGVYKEVDSSAPGAIMASSNMYTVINPNTLFVRTETGNYTKDGKTITSAEYNELEDKTGYEKEYKFTQATGLTAGSSLPDGEYYVKGQGANTYEEFIRPSNNLTIIGGQGVSIICDGDTGSAGEGCVLKNNVTEGTGYLVGGSGRWFADEEETAKKVTSREGYYYLDDAGKAQKVPLNWFEEVDGGYRLQADYFIKNIYKQGGNTEYLDGSVPTDTSTVTNGQGKVGTCISVDEANDQYGEDGNFITALTGLQNSFPDANVNDFQVVVYQDGTFGFVMSEDLTNPDNQVYIYNPGEGSYEKAMEEGSYSITYDSAGNVTGITTGTGTASLTTTQGYDELAYDAAMAQYTADKAEYDREQDRLNKQTSIYQRQDKQLELKLTRLDNERNALNTEIEAVKKVIQDAVERGFKTFSG